MAHTFSTPRTVFGNLSPFAENVPAFPRISIMANYTVTVEDGKQIIVWASTKESAKAKAQAKYKRRKGKKGRIVSTN